MQIAPIVESFFAPLLDEGLSLGESVEQVRENIIIDSQSRYFDWTASGLAYKTIESRIAQILPFYSNTHSFSSSHSKITSALYDEARARLKQALALDEDFLLIACGSGASGAIKKFQELLGVYIPPQSKRRIPANLKKTSLPKVFISSYEHHSNEISLRDGLCEIVKIGLDCAGRFDVSALEEELKQAQKEGREVIGSFCAVSNVSGIISPQEKIAKLFGKYAPNAPLAFDAASASAHTNIESTHCNALFLAPHKLLGGVQSCGLLAMQKRFFQTPSPSFSGGGVIEYASNDGHLYVEDYERREEAGTPPIIGLLRAALAYQLRNEVGLANILRRERVLTQIFLNELKKIPAISLYGDWQSERSDALGIISFNVACVSPFDLSVLLSQKFGIQTRAGCSCAGPYGHYLMELDSLNFKSAESKKLLYSLLKNPQKRPGWLRVSLHYTHSLQDIEYVIESIQHCIKILRS